MFLTERVVGSSFHPQRVELLLSAILNCLETSELVFRQTHRGCELAQALPPPAAGGGNACAGRNKESCEALQASRRTMFLTERVVGSRFTRQGGAFAQPVKKDESGN